MSVRVQWSGFVDSVCGWLRTLQGSARLADVTLVAGGRSLRAHRLVLSACSPFFRAIFEQNPFENPIIILQDISASDLFSIVSYIYNGEVNVTEENLPKLIKAAECLQIKGLSFHTDSEETSKDPIDFTNKQSNNLDINDTDLTDSIKKENISDEDCLYVDTLMKEIEPKLEPLDNVEVETATEEDREVEQIVSPYLNIEKNKCNEMESEERIKAKRPKLDKRKSERTPQTRSSTKNNKENENSLVSEDGTQVKNCETAVTDWENEIESVLLGKEVEGNIDNTVEETEETFCLDGGPDAGPDADFNGRAAFPCPFCSRVYHCWGYRRRHVKARHESNSLSCKICLIMLNSEVTWFSHMINNHGISQTEARNSLVIMVEAHTVLSCLSPPSPVSMLHHLQLDSFLKHSDDGDPIPQRIEEYVGI